MQRIKHSPSPKRLTAIQTSRHLRVSHHKHTGHILPRASTSYPMLTMIVLCVGVLIGGWTSVVHAGTGTTVNDPSNPYGPPQSSSYVVHASVPAPAPTQAATIDSPATGTRYSDKPIIVSGTCPVDANGGYVSVYRNNFYSGTAICDAEGHYQLSTDLFSGANKLIARVFNFTDVAGPDSDPVTVYYDPPAPPTIPDEQTPTSVASTSPDSSSAKQGFSINSTPATTDNTTTSTSPSTNSSASSGSATTAKPLVLSTDFTIRGYYVGQQSVWQLDLEGGTGPYAIAVDWGDGSNGIVSRGSSGPTRLTHTYEKAGGYQGSYIVKFTATDASGGQTFLQLLVVVNSRTPSTVGRTSQSGGGAGFSSGVLHTLAAYIWPSYGLVLLMLLSFWLGERREFHLLKPRLRRGAVLK